MSERLGHLVYGTACLIAAVALCLAAYVATEGPPEKWPAIGILAGGGVVIWMGGRAVRHALARPRRAEGPSHGHDG